MAKALTVKAIEALKGGVSRKEVPDGVLAGLYLVVQPSGAKSWAVRYRVAGQSKKLTLGQWPAIDLGSARDIARKALVTVAEGSDPNAQKKAAKQSASDAAAARDRVEEVVASFVERYVKPNNKPSTAKETERLLLKDVVPAWKGRRIQTVARRDVIELLDAVADRGATVLANRVLAALRRMFNWCIERGIVDASPCDRIKAPSAETSRDRVLGDDELRLVWTAAERLGWPFGPLVRLLMLTGQRREEVAGMRWGEVDLAKRLWTIPKERAKNGQAHDVPLSALAVDILQNVPRVAGRAGFVFSTTGESSVSGYSNAKERLDRIMLDLAREEAKAAGVSDADAAKIELADWRFHDFRRTVASNMARLGISLPVIEKLLNHTSGSFAGVVGVYQRHNYADEKRAAVEAWESFLQSSRNGPLGNVIPLRSQTPFHRTNTI